MGLYYLTGLLFIAMCAVGAMMRRSSTGYRRLREGRVTGIVGRKGHGKTLFAVHEMLRHIGSNQPCRKCSRHGERISHKGTVVTNVALDLGPELNKYFVHVTSLEHLISLLPTDASDERTGKIPHQSLVLIDEAHLWFPAKAGAQLADNVASFLAQCRKYAVEVIWLAQREDRAALGLRAQTDEVGICQRGYVRGMTVKFCEPENVAALRAKKKDVRADWTFRYRVTPRVSSAYDTYQLIDNSGVSSESAGTSSPQAKRGPTSAPLEDRRPTSITTREGSTYRHIA